MSTPEGRNYHLIPRLNLLPPPRPSKLYVFLSNVGAVILLILLSPIILPLYFFIEGIPYIELKVHEGWIAAVRAVTGTRVRFSIRDAVKIALKEAGKEGPGTLLIEETALYYNIYVELVPSKSPDTPCLAARVLVNVDTGIVRSSEYVPCIHQHYAEEGGALITSIPFDHN